jgi:hypothetical protein
MNAEVTADSIDRGLEHLRKLAPDPNRADRLRAKLRTELVRREARARRGARRWGAVRGVLAPVLVGGLCVLYLAAVVGNALRLNGVL